MNEYPSRASGGPGWFAVLFISLCSSFAAVSLFYWALVTGWLPASLPGSKAPVAAAPAQVKVPELVGLPVATAGELLEARGLRFVVRERRSDEQVPADAVAAQEPLAGSSLAAASEVTVIVSSGRPSQVLLPDLRGQSLEAARNTLASLGLVVGPVAGPDDGIVKGTQPPGGQELSKGAMVGLSLEAAGVEVPKLVGLSFRAAKAALEKAGFTLGKVRERYDENRSGGVILEQSLEPASRAAKATPIDLVRNEDY